VCRIDDVTNTPRQQTNSEGQDINMNKHMAILVVIVMIFGATAANAAKCKWMTDTVSYRTGEPVRWTRWVRNRAFHSLGKGYAAIAGISEGEQKYLGLQVIAPYRTMNTRPTKADMDATFVIPQGSILAISMADNSIYELVVPEDLIGDAALVTEEDVFADEGPKAKGASGYVIESFAVIKFPLDAEAIAALSAQGARNLRLNANGIDYAFSFGKKPVNKIQKVLDCIQ